MNVLIHIHYQISNYSSLIDDLQRDSDDDETHEKTDTLEIPFQEDSHFKKFAIKYRTRESVEDVKLVLAKLEKESLLLNLIPIAYDDELEKDVQFNELFVNTKDSINIIWDFILISSRFYGEPEGLFECYADEFKRLDKYFLEHSTLPLAESEVIVDIFKYYININDNLLGQRNIEIGTDAIDTLRGDTDVVMEETLVPTVTDRIGNISLNDLILSIAEVQMTSWKPDIKGIMQQFQEYDNEGYNISRCLFDVVQNSKLRFITCSEVFLFGLNYTESPSIASWTGRTIDNYPASSLPSTFEELQLIPLDKKYNFLMSLDRDSINKEIQRLGVEALMFWELPKVETALNELCAKWFFSYTGTIDITEDKMDADSISTTAQPSIAIVGSVTEKKQCVELGFVDKLIQLWKLRKTIQEAKAEISVSGSLARYNYKAGEAIMNKTMTYKSSYMKQLFRKRNFIITKEERRLASLNMYENYLCQYKAILLQCEREYELMINV